MKLVIAIPTRQRKEKFFQCLRIAQEKISNPETRFHVVADSDDVVMTHDNTKKVLAMYGNLTTTYGKSDSKIGAVNRCAKEARDWDVLLLLSDDMVCLQKGFDQEIIDAMQLHHPDTDGALWFSDGNENYKPSTKDLNTIICIGRKYYERFGYLYHPAYKSFFSDNEYTEVGKSLGKLTRIDKVLIEHQHPLFNAGQRAKVKSDVLYMKNDRHWQEDEKVYFARKADGFGIGVKLPVKVDSQKEVKRSHKPVLSILIPTVSGREKQFTKLRTFIQHQIDRLNIYEQVEVIHLKDNKEMTIGEKRNRLFEKANGIYSVQIDDDDWLHYDYIRLILDAAKDGADCIGYKELCIWSGKKVESSVFSKKYPEWKDNYDGFDHVRSPFYKCPIKTEICLREKFKGIRFGEDHEWSKRIFPLIKSETFIDEFMYVYQHMPEDHNKKYGIKQPELVG